jgi:hypothetical protein
MARTTSPTSRWHKFAFTLLWTFSVVLTILARKSPQPPQNVNKSVDTFRKVGMYLTKHFPIANHVSYRQVSWEKPPSSLKNKPQRPLRAPANPKARLLTRPHPTLKPLAPANVFIAEENGGFPGYQKISEPPSLLGGGSGIRHGAPFVPPLAPSPKPATPSKYLELLHGLPEHPTSPSVQKVYIDGPRPQHLT